jgi:hypothetical protein
MVDFKQWRISLWDPIYWTRSEEGLTIGGNLHNWEDQQQYDVAFKMDGETTAAVEMRVGMSLEKGPLSKTFQKVESSEAETDEKLNKLMKLTDGLWLACKYSAIDSIESCGVTQGGESTFPIVARNLPWS